MWMNVILIMATVTISVLILWGRMNVHVRRVTGLVLTDGPALVSYFYILKAIKVFPTDLKCEFNWDFHRSWDFGRPTWAIPECGQGRAMCNVWNPSSSSSNFLVLPKINGRWTLKSPGRVWKPKPCVLEISTILTVFLYYLMKFNILWKKGSQILLWWTKASFPLKSVVWFWISASVTSTEFSLAT